MQKIWITLLVELAPNAKRKEAVMMIHTVEEDGSVKVHWLSPEKAEAAGVVPQIVSDMSKGKLVTCGGAFDSRGRLQVIKRL